MSHDVQVGVTVAKEEEKVAAMVITLAFPLAVTRQRPDQALLLLLLPLIVMDQHPIVIVLVIAVVLVLVGTVTN